MNQTGDPFTEPNRLQMPIFSVADVALQLTLIVSGVELPFNRVTSVIFCFKTKRFA